MSDNSKKIENLIFCTGFDIFEGHKERNASWEAVKLLPDSVTHNSVEYKIEKLKVPVTYEGVDEIVPQIWDRNPMLVVHCGVSSMATHITLEACAYNLGYCRPDFNCKYLPGNFAVLTQNGKNKKILLTKLDVEKIAKDLNGIEIGDDCECRPNGDVNVKSGKFVCSRDVGSYLCGYIYLRSLDYNLDRSLFVHVPEIGKPLSSEDTSKGILDVIKKCLDQLTS
uniref:CSON010651 protein n=1 Tax=Culicoides sonorensis TaxID=179676 RepID=A0A336M619_CULSO